MKRIKNKKHDSEKLEPDDINVQFNYSDDVYQASACYDRLQLAIAHSSLASAPVCRRVAKRFTFQAESEYWKACTTVTERNMYRRLAKYLEDLARRKRGA